jgi:tetratricopeptide (TPR) repeat protein
MQNSRVDQLIRQGQAAAQVGNNDLAREYLQAAVDLDPTNVTALLWLSGVLPDPMKAGATLERVLELDPGNVRAQAGLAHLQQQLSQRATALATSYVEPPAPAAFQPPATTPTQERAVRPLSIEQELRASLRPDPVSRGGTRGLTPDRETVSARRVVVFSGGSDMAFRVLVILLLISLAAGALFVLVSLL